MTPVFWLLLHGGCPANDASLPGDGGGQARESAHPPESQHVASAAPGATCAELQQLDARLRRIGSTLDPPAGSLSPDESKMLLEAAEFLTEVRDGLEAEMASAGVVCVAAPAR